MRAPPEAEIYAPEFPPKLRWLNSPFVRVATLLRTHALLVEFFDFARINSLRTLPYLTEWHARYADKGLAIVGVLTPGYSFGRDRDLCARAVDRLGINYPVVLDPRGEIWQLYGNEGWPARYLFDWRSVLRYMHYGEGDYQATELCIQEVLTEIDSDLSPPAPLEPLRAEDRPQALLRPQTADIWLPQDRHRLRLVRDWIEGSDYLEALDAGGGAMATWHGKQAFAVLSGSVEPGLYETDGRVVADSPGLRVHGFQFTPELWQPD